ncbi:MAG: hypothetical protein ACREN8_02360 [Candidatus Dormibacteraceae bacterium]
MAEDKKGGLFTAEEVEAFRALQDPDTEAAGAARLAELHPELREPRETPEDPGDFDVTG